VNSGCHSGTHKNEISFLLRFWGYHHYLDLHRDITSFRTDLHILFPNILSRRTLAHIPVGTFTFDLISARRLKLTFSQFENRTMSLAPKVVKLGDYTRGTAPKIQMRTR